MKIFQDKYCMGHTYIKTSSLFIWNSDLIWGNTNPTSSAHRAYVPTPGCCACWLLMASTCPICWGLGWKVCAYVCRAVHRNEGTSCGKLRFLPPPSKVGNLWLWLTDRSHRRQAPFLPEGSHLCAVCCVLHSWPGGPGGARFQPTPHPEPFSPLLSAASPPTLRLIPQSFHKTPCLKTYLSLKTNLRQLLMIWIFSSFL